jgi:hypothetical protein
MQPLPWTRRVYLFIHLSISLSSFHQHWGSWYGAIKTNWGIRLTTLIQLHILLRHSHLSGMWFGMALGMDKKRTCIWKRLDCVLKHENKYGSKVTIIGGGGYMTILWVWESSLWYMNKIFTLAPKIMRIVATTSKKWLFKTPSTLLGPPCVGFSESRTKLWPLDWIKSYLIWLAIANQKDRHFKF